MVLGWMSKYPDTFNFVTDELHCKFMADDIVNGHTDFAELLSGARVRR